MNSFIRKRDDKPYYGEPNEPRYGKPVSESQPKQVHQMPRLRRTNPDDAQLERNDSSNRNPFDNS